jgi:hypothetical protein
MDLVAHDADMSAPEYNNAAPKAYQIRVKSERRADGFSLLIGVTWRRYPGRFERDLHEALAIDAKARLAAPEIRQAGLC